MDNLQVSASFTEPIHRREALRLAHDPFFRALKLVKYKVKNLMHAEPRQEFSFVQFYRYKCIFVHIPKTAGVSVAASLFKNRGGGHETIQYYQSIFQPQDFDRFFKFTFVRNPWARLHSAYHYLKAGGFGPNDRKWFAENLAQYRDFEDFVLNWVHKENIRKWPHFRPQVDFILDKDGVNRMDFVGRMEQIDDDFRELTIRLGIKRIVTKRNATSGKADMRGSYTPEMVSHVQMVYEQDVSVLNYQF